MKYILILVYIFCTTSGITFMKLGGDSLHLGIKGGLSFGVSWTTFLGLLFYLVSFLLWQRIVVKYDLSIIVPIVNGIVQVITLIIGHFIFKETLSVTSYIGTFLVIIGIVKANKAEDPELPVVGKIATSIFSKKIDA